MATYANSNGSRETDPSTSTPAQQNYWDDRQRLRGRKRALLGLLTDGKSYPNYECARVAGLSFNGYLYQLRKDGWKIESRHVAGGVWEQRLVGKGTPPERRPKLSGPQRNVADQQSVVGVSCASVLDDQGREMLKETLQSALPVDLRDRQRVGVSGHWR